MLIDLPAGHHDRSIAISNRLIAKSDSPQPRTAQLIYQIGRRFDGHTGFHCSLPCGILALRGGKNLPQDDLRYFCRRDFCALKGRADCHRAKLVRRQIRERPIEGPDRRSRPGSDHNIHHVTSFRLFSHW